MEPENSIKAFRKAHELNLEGVELDVWLTKDDVPIVVHGIKGGFVELADNAKELIANIESANLGNYTLKNGEKIPTLAAVLDTCLDCVCINIEIKETREEVMGYVLDLLEERDMFEQICFSSFNHFLRKALTQEVERRNIPHKIAFGFLIEEKELTIPKWEEECHEGDSLNVDIRYLEKRQEECLESIKSARLQKMTIGFWFPMDYTHEDSFWDELSSLEIDTIITNKPIDCTEYFSKRAFAHQELGV